MTNDRYIIAPESEYGILVVRFDGRKVGQSQTEAGCRLIRRNHHNRQES